jgi:hypothetical protein
MFVYCYKFVVKHFWFKIPFYFYWYIYFYFLILIQLLNIFIFISTTIFYHFIFFLFFIFSYLSSSIFYQSFCLILVLYLNYLIYFITCSWMLLMDISYCVQLRWGNTGVIVVVDWNVNEGRDEVIHWEIEWWLIFSSDISIFKINQIK